MRSLLKYCVVGLALLATSVAFGIGDGDDDGDGGGLGLGGSVSRAELIEASRFASQATFGMDYEGIEQIAKTGRNFWLEQQFKTSPSYLKPIAVDLITKQDEGEWPEFVDNPFKLRNVIHRFAWWQQTMTGPDVVRQRVAYALSQFFVVSDNVEVLRNNPYSITSYYDLLLRNAFGNFRDLLRDVALSPAMGTYLSHANNSKTIPEDNIFPDQNFAREVMQLFSIGLHELNIDGSVKLDSEGDLIPTYDNDDIAELAKVFTGLTYAGPGHYWGRNWFNHADQFVFSWPMTMYEGYHEPGEKTLIDGTVLPDGQSGMQDVEAAIDCLFNHPNVGPFFGKQLIQRLVTSNPSRAYIERVARAFNGENGTPRGDMKAVLRAVFFDPEAETQGHYEGFGRLREPAVRIVKLARVFNYHSETDVFYNTGYRLAYFVGQHPLASPSVFNFFQPNYAPTGEIAERGMVAPEFQITTATTIIGLINQIGLAVFNENEAFHTWYPPFENPRITLTDYETLAEDPEELLDRLDIVLTQGQLSQDTREVILDVLDRMEDRMDRAKTAIYLMLISPEFAIEE